MTHQTPCWEIERVFRGRLSYRIEVLFYHSSCIEVSGGNLTINISTFHEFSKRFELSGAVERLKRLERLERTDPGGFVLVRIKPVLSR